MNPGSEQGAVTALVKQPPAPAHLHEESGLGGSAPCSIRVEACVRSGRCWAGRAVSPEASVLAGKQPFLSEVDIFML